MTRWKLTIEFDGTGFLGWQRQRGGRTVQGELEKALGTFCRSEIHTTGQGRTDRGVHAKGQVAHADLPEAVSAQQLLAAMRGLLPEDMAVIDAEPVDDLFHARFNALSRRYSYHMVTRPVPINRQTCWVLIQKIEAEPLHDCAEMIIGEHDFRNFAKLPEEPVQNTRCLITESSWSCEGHIWTYTIEGNRFLRHMVRRLVGTMHRVAAKKLNREDFQTLLKGPPAKRKGHAAPPEGLVLEAVTYKF